MFEDPQIESKTGRAASTRGEPRPSAQFSSITYTSSSRGVKETPALRLMKSLRGITWIHGAGERDASDGQSKFLVLYVSDAEACDKSLIPLMFEGMAVKLITVGSQFRFATHTVLVPRPSSP